MGNAPSPLPVIRLVITRTAEEQPKDQRESAHDRHALYARWLRVAGLGRGRQGYSGVAAASYCAR